MLQEYANQALAIAYRGGSESQLEQALNPLLERLLAEHDINYTPEINATLKSLGLHQTSTDRPDSLFGTVVLDYKRAGRLSESSALAKDKRKVKDYLEQASGGHLEDPQSCQRWAGVLWDGFHLLFCHSNGHEWCWTGPHETSAESLLTLVQTYRALDRKPLTGRGLGYAFGKRSPTARAILPTLCWHLSRPEHRTSMLFREWSRLFQQVSTYTLPQIPSLQEWAIQNKLPTDDAAIVLFAFHTYYSIVIKLLTSELLTATQPELRGSLIDDIVNSPSDDSLIRTFAELEDIEYYRRLRISNFLEGDFFSWYTTEFSADLANGLRQIARTLHGFEPATPRLTPHAIKDLLKEFYQSLVDEQVRHDLGEYYTPDWLAQHVLDQVGYLGDPGQKVIDPTCGSGTFIVECINRLRNRCRQEGMDDLQTLETVTHCVRGLDLNPLAVISARANYILAIADLVFAHGSEFEIPVYLADAINLPVEREGALEYTLDTEVEDLRLHIPLRLVREQMLGKVLLRCEEDINRQRTESQFLGDS